MEPVDRSYRRIWQISLGSFILAALTGLLFRLGMLYPLPGWLNLINIRHAHSHLMFFNWISPPIMAWMATSLAANSTKPVDHSRYKKCLYTMLFLGVLAYPFFLMYGYQVVSIGSANLPIAAILSGFVMFTWYWFAWLYFSDRKQTETTISILIFDGALTALLISSFGAWGVSVFQFSGIHNPLISSALTHFFLSVFTEGWAVLGILGILWDEMEEQKIPFNSGLLWKPILLGSILLFPFGLTPSLIPPLTLISAKIGLVLVVISLSLNVYVFFTSKRWSGFVQNTILALIGMKILFQIIVLLPIDMWPGEHGLQILYLHLLLLGIVSITLIQGFSPNDQLFPKQLFAGTVLLVLASLVLISGYWPSSLTPAQPYQWVAIFAILPVIPAGWLLANSFKG